MKYIEIDGERIEVRGCDDCPCCDMGDGGFGAECKHPSVSELWCDGMYRHGPFIEDAKCPLREVKE